MDPSHVEQIQDLTAQAEQQERENVYGTVDLGERFADVEALLFTGFLTSPADIGGRIKLVLKSLTATELRMAGIYSLGVDGVNPSKQNLYLIACSVFLMDGTNVLAKRGEMLDALLEAFASLTTEMQFLLMVRIVHLLERSRLALHQVEGYCWHPASRQRWLAVRGHNLCLSSLTGVLGTDVLGLNKVQEIWIALNQMEDHRIRNESEWDNAKFVASTWSKQVRNIDAKDRTRRRRMDLERQQEFLKAAGIAEIEASKRVRVSAESTEELLGQLNRTMRGEKDLHDLIVEKHERQIRLDYEAQLEERRRLRDRVPDYGGYVNQSVQVLHPDQVREFMNLERARREESRLERIAQGGPDQPVPESKRLALLERLAKPKVLRATATGLIDELVVRMSPDDAASYVHDGNVDRPVRSEDT